MERHLAAIMAADVVGYTSLVQADEAATLRRMKAIWAEVFEPNVTGHRGRIFKTEPPRFSRRLFGLSHATIASSLICA
jgi:class 3 adenylate cyclase